MKKTACLLFAVCLFCSFLPASGAELPAVLYFNPNGGSYYHADPACPSVKKEYLPMTAFDSSLLGTPEFNFLKPCTRCAGTAEPPAYPQLLESGEQEPAAAGITIGSEEAARAFAVAFFALPYVEEPLTGRTLTVAQTQDGWRATLASADGVLTVSFTAGGRISQYENSAYPLPPISGITVDSLPLYTVRRIDALRNALFPDMPNNTCGVYARVGDAAYYALDSFTFWLGLVMEAEMTKLVAYVDLETDAARYPGYLTRGEAAEEAKRAIAEGFGLNAKQTETLALLQANFTLQDKAWTDADVPLPYWYLVFGDEADGTKTRYEALIDAETGDMLELHDPASAGNG